jgi:hypothetical protein
MGLGTRWYVSRRFALRTDALFSLWKITTPVGFGDPQYDLGSVPFRNGVGARPLHHGRAPVPVVKSGFESRTADWLGVDEALARILAEAAPLLGPSAARSRDCLGRALAEEVVAEATLPPWDNSAMDGFAVRGADVRGARADAPVRLERRAAACAPARVRDRRSRPARPCGS